MKTIFVSSTFKDMHFERDAIQEITLPRLRAKARPHGESISFCDLRWGINTGDLDSDAGSRKVLDVCLDEIDRCQPPMVVILGDRYGWIPSEELTGNAARRKAVQLDDLRISVTALEIAYGALSTPERQRSTLFYFRHIEDECPADYAVEGVEHKQKLEELKATIDRITGGRLRHYTVRWNSQAQRLEGVDAFAEMLAEDIGAILAPEWEELRQLSPFVRERRVHWAFIREKNAMFSARRSLVERYFERLSAGGEHTLILKAPAGSGKSMLWGSLALRFQVAGWDVLPIVSGLTIASGDSVSLLRQIICHLEDVLGEGDTDPIFPAGEMASTGETARPGALVDRLRERLHALCQAYEQTGGRLVIMVDAADQLQEDEHRDRLVFLPGRLSEHIKFVMTCLPELKTTGLAVDSVAPITTEERREMVLGILGAQGRELEPCVIDCMVTTAAHADNPLYLNLLVQRLLMMNHDDFWAIRQSGDDMAAISNRQMELIRTCPDTLQGMSMALLREAGERINGHLAHDAAVLLAISRHGLRREDLAALLGGAWSDLDFAHFISYMSDSFILRDDGRFDFSHKSFREGYVAACDDPTALHRRIARYLAGCPHGDAVQEQELVYHSLQAGETEILFDHLAALDCDSTASRQAIQDLFAFCLGDRGAWLSARLTAGEVPVVAALWLTLEMPGAPRSRAEYGVAEAILACILPLADEMAAQRGDAMSQANASLIHNQYAFVADAAGGAENIRLALGHYERSLTLMQVADRLSPGEYGEMLALRHANVAYQLRMLNNLQSCLEQMQACIRIRERMLAAEDGDTGRARHLSRLLADAYDEMGNLYGNFNDLELEEHRVLYYRKALEHRERYIDRDDVAAWLTVGRACLSIGAAYKDMAAGLRNPSKAALALEFLGRAETVTCRLMQLSSDVAIKQIYAGACVQAGNLRAAQRMGDMEPCYRKAYDVLQPYFTDGRQEPTLVGVYLAASLGLGISLYTRKGAENARGAIVLLAPVLGQYREIYDRYPSADNLQNLIATYGHLIAAHIALPRAEATACEELYRACEATYTQYVATYGANGGVAHAMADLKGIVTSYRVKQGRILEAFKGFGSALSTAASSTVSDFDTGGVQNQVEQRPQRGHKAASSRKKLRIFCGIAWLLTLAGAILTLVRSWLPEDVTPPPSADPELYDRLAATLAALRTAMTPLLILLSWLFFGAFHHLLARMPKVAKWGMYVAYLLILILWAANWIL